MRVKLIFIVFVSFFFIEGYSQTQENIYFSGDDSDKAYSINKKGENYVICGTTRSTSVGSNDIILFEIEESGNVMWMNTYGFVSSEEAFDVCSSQSGKIGIVGYTWAGAYMHNPFMYIIGSTGQLEQEEYVNDNMSGIGFSIIEDSDGGFSYSGYTTPAGTMGGQVFLTKMDNQGTILWNKEYGDSPEEHFFSHIQTQDNGYLMVGTKDGFMFNFVWREYWTTNSNIYIIKTDTEGNLEWDKTISGTYNDFAKCVKQAPDGGYYILGSTQSVGSGSFDMYLIKISATGESEWEKTFGNSDFEYGYDMCISDDNNLYLSGVSRTDETESVDIYVVKTDLDGNVLWEKFYGDTYSDYVFGIENTSTNGCMLVGTTNDEYFGNGSYNLLVIKLSNEGEIEELLNLDTAQMFEVSVYPNPGIDIVNISIMDIESLYSTSTLRIIDVYGREVYKEDIESRTTTINTSKYAAGVYFIEITMAGNRKYIKKLVIQSAF